MLSLLKQITLRQAQGNHTKDFTINSLDQLLQLFDNYVHTQNGTCSTGVDCETFDCGFQSKKLIDLHHQKTALLLDKYFPCVYPDPQTEFLFTSLGLTPEDYNAWLDDRGQFWVYSCSKKEFKKPIEPTQKEINEISLEKPELDYEGCYKLAKDRKELAWIRRKINNNDDELQEEITHISEYIIPNVKGKRWNPYIRYISTKHSGAAQTEKMLDLVGLDPNTVYNSINTPVFNFLVLTFPWEIGKLLIDSKKRNTIKNLIWKCWKLFFKELHFLFDIPYDHLLGASVSYHCWKSSFPLFPHPHLHVCFPNFHYKDLNDCCGHVDGKFKHIKNNGRIDIENLSDVEKLYDELYSLVEEETWFDEKHKSKSSTGLGVKIGMKKTSRFINSKNEELLKSLKEKLSGSLKDYIGFTPFKWYNPNTDSIINPPVELTEENIKLAMDELRDLLQELKQGTLVVDERVEKPKVPLDIGVLKSIWHDCVLSVFKDYLKDPDYDMIGFNVDFDEEGSFDGSIPLYDVHTHFVYPKQRERILHHMRYKSRPPVLDLDLFFRKCKSLVSLDISTLKPLFFKESVFSYLTMLKGVAKKNNDEDQLLVVESTWRKAEEVFDSNSDNEIIDWLKYLVSCQSDTRVFGFWRMMDRYRVTSVIRGELPKKHICPICGGESVKLCKVDSIVPDIVVFVLNSKFRVVDFKGRPSIETVKPLL